MWFIFISAHRFLAGLLPLRPYERTGTGLVRREPLIRRVGLAPTVTHPSRAAASGLFIVTQRFLYSCVFQRRGVCSLQNLANGPRRAAEKHRDGRGIAVTINRSLLPELHLHFILDLF